MLSKTIISSKCVYKTIEKFVIFLLIVAIIATVIFGVLYFVYKNQATEANVAMKRTDFSYKSSFQDQFDWLVAYGTRERAKENSAKFLKAGYIGVGTVAAIVILLIIIRSVSDTSLLVTKDKLHGFTTSRDFIDIPLDSITAVYSSGKKGITIESASGKAVFSGLTNRDEVLKVICDLLLENSPAE